MSTMTNKEFPGSRGGASPWGSRAWFKHLLDGYDPDSASSYFNQEGSGYERCRRAATVRRAQAWLGLRPGDRILDMGCALGALSAALGQAMPGVEVVGVDFLHDAAAKASARHPELAFVAAGLPLLPFADGSFAAVVAAEMLYYVPRGQRAAAWDEILRVLVPGGRVLLTSYLDGGESYFSRSGLMELARRGARIERVEDDHHGQYHGLSNLLGKAALLARHCRGEVDARHQAATGTARFVLAATQAPVAGPVLSMAARIAGGMAETVLSWRWLPAAMCAVSRTVSTRCGSNVSVLAAKRDPAEGAGEVHLRFEVCDAALCAPVSLAVAECRDETGRVVRRERADRQGRFEISGVGAKAVLHVRAPGFRPKRFPVSGVPERVRLLADVPAGYHDTLWTRPGEELVLRAHLPAPTHATLCRHGLEREEVLDLGILHAQAQDVPDGNFSDAGLAWAESVRYKVPGDARPGIYSLRLECDGHLVAAVPLAVCTSATRRGTGNRLLLLVSTTTWQSYNIWGGRSRYRNFELGGHSAFLANRPASLRARAERYVYTRFPRSFVDFLRRLLGRTGAEGGREAWRYRPLTVNRPFPHCALDQPGPHERFINHLAAGEWRLAAWLEREGVGYDVASLHELHYDPDLLDTYDAVILSTHCEYWSREMFEALRTHHEEHGLWVLNLSGNSIYREIEFLDSGATRWKGVFHETCADEAALLGVRLSVSSYGTAAPYKVRKPRHWVFKGLDVRRGSLLGADSLNRWVPLPRPGYDPGRPGTAGGLRGRGASGWEADALVGTAPPDCEVVARGANPGGGAAMVVRAPAGKRGGMFSASSILFGGCLLVDDMASGVVRNVIAKALGGGDGGA